MRLIVAAVFALLSAAPVLAEDPSQEEMDEVAACVIGHAALMIIYGEGDADNAAMQAFKDCPPIHFDDMDAAETWEESILRVLYDIGK